MLDKIKLWFKNSVTILWARVQVLAGIVGAALVGLAADPTFQASIQDYAKQYWWAFLIIFGVLTEIARRRTVGRQTTSQNRIVG